MTEPGRRALDGVRIVEIAFGGAAPISTKLLADYGADVIKIESRARPDFTRTVPPFADGKAGLDRTTYFTNRNASKRSIELNLKEDGHAAAARNLAEQADVLLTNFRPGVLNQYRLDYDSVCRTNPSLIYVSSPMRGAGSPGAGDRGVGRSVSALTGILGLVGYSETEVIGPGTHFPDHGSNPGHTLVVIMAALLRRRRDGVGTLIEVSQVPSTLQLVGPELLNYEANGTITRARGNNDECAAPFGVFRLGVSDGQDDREAWVALAVRTDEQWQALCRAIGDAELVGDARFESAAARTKRGGEVNALVADWLRDYGRDREPGDVANMLQASGVPAAPCSTARDLVESDPFVRETGRLVELPHAEMGSAIYNVPPYRYLDGSEPRLASSPLLGEHTDAILRDWLGKERADFGIPETFPETTVHFGS